MYTKASVIQVMDKPAQRLDMRENHTRREITKDYKALLRVVAVCLVRRVPMHRTYRKTMSQAHRLDESTM